MKYAIVESGGKQYKAIEGKAIDVDRLPLEPGDEIDLVNVLLVADGENVTVGTPKVDGTKVIATVVEHVRGPKIVVFKYSPRKRIRVKRGHRQQYTRLMINKIAADTKKAKAEKAEDKPEAKAPAKKTAAKKASTTKKKTETKKASTGKKPAAKKTSTKKSSEK
ncbi:MAG: hypothetical protein Kow002_08800 [Anaerolineales bacterium]